MSRHGGGQSHRPDDGGLHFSKLRVTLLPGATRVVCGDLNADGLADLVAARRGAFPFPAQVSVFRNLSRPPLSQDRNPNKVPDECEVFRRGDFREDGAVDLTDAVHLLRFEFHSGDPETFEVPGRGGRRR